MLRPPSTRFPPVASANEDGLLMLGGRLDIDWLLEAYRSGIFPWPIPLGDEDVLAWFSPDPRAVLELDALHVSRRLRRRLRSGQFEVTRNRDFDSVIAGCAAPRADGEATWISADLARAYRALHRQGYAHSVEVWADGRLAGGVYGVALGGLFCGESMFYRRPDASKVALVELVGHLRRQGFALLDIQQTTPHMTRMGATEIPRDLYLRRLRDALRLPVSFVA